MVDRFRAASHIAPMRLLAMLPLALLLAVAMPATARAEISDFGIGLQAGNADPAGITIKLRLSADDALQFAVGSSFGCLTPSGPCGYQPFAATADYIRHFYQAIRVRSAVKIPVYFGVGLGTTYVASPNFSLGVRLPIGIAIQPDAIPLEFFLQAVPGLVFNTYVAPIAFGIGAAAGVRFYF